MEWEQSLIGIFHTGQKLCLMVFHIWLCNNRGLNYIAAFHKKNWNWYYNGNRNIFAILLCKSKHIFYSTLGTIFFKFDINLHCNEFTINVGLRIMKNNFQMDLYSFYVKEDSIEIFGLLHWIKLLWVMTEYMVERGNPISEKCSITC